MDFANLSMALDTERQVTAALQRRLIVLADGGEDIGDSTHATDGGEASGSGAMGITAVQQGSVDNSSGRKKCGAISAENILNVFISAL